MTDLTGDRAPTKRFSDRVDAYERYRPGYPPELLDLLREAVGLAAGWRVADLGAGTGLLTELLLQHGNRVVAVEPNDAMRGALERNLGHRHGLEVVAGRAEATGLADASVDLVTAGQAFHWFDPHEARRECRRILRPPRSAALVWNTRDLDDPLMAAYEEVLRTWCPEYEDVQHRGEDYEDDLRAFFGRDPERRTIPNGQRFDRDGLKGRFLSSSYAPREGEPGHGEALDALDDLFDEHQEGGVVDFVYVTEVFSGTLG